MLRCFTYTKKDLQPPFLCFGEFSSITVSGPRRILSPYCPILFPSIIHEYTILKIHIWRQILVSISLYWISNTCTVFHFMQYSIIYDMWLDVELYIYQISQQNLVKHIPCVNVYIDVQNPWFLYENIRQYTCWVSTSMFIYRRVYPSLSHFYPITLPYPMFKWHLIVIHMIIPSWDKHILL